MTTRVVHVNSEDWRNTPEDQRVYIGRRNNRRSLPESEWANPYVIGKDGTREEVVEAFEGEMWVSPFECRNARSKLRDKVLGCWCHPELCHGDVLARLADMSDQEFEEWLNQ